MAIVDVYDALVSARPYKKPLTHAEAVKIIEKEKGSQFDPLIAEAFLNVSDQMCVEAEKFRRLIQKE